MNYAPVGPIKLSDSEFDYFVKYVGQNYGIDLSKKRHLIEARLAGELKARGFTSYGPYIDMLKADRTDKALETVINKLTTNYSFFSRETDHFDYLANTVLPTFAQQGKRSLKIWSAGCSTGQEPYNIAMAIDGALGTKRGLWSVSITATDVSTDALNVAAAAVYPETALESMHAGWKTQYMTRLPDGNFQVAPNIKGMVSFKRFNLMDRFPYTNHFDVIFCRNVMIYFKPQTTQELVKKFYQANTDGGYFFISHSETISRFDTEYSYLSPSIYRKLKK